MIVTETAFNVIGKLIDRLKIKELITVLLIVGLLILFLPDKFLNILGLQVWRDNYRSHIGGCVLICAIFCLIWIIIWIKNKLFFSTFAYMRVSRKYLKKIISKEEKEFLIRNFFNFDRMEFDSSAQLDITSGNVYLLQNAYIIAPSAKASKCADRWAYSIQPNVRIYLNKAIQKKKIIITPNGYTWKL